MDADDNPYRGTGPTVYTYATVEAAYSAAIRDTLIQDGDVLYVPSARFAAIMGADTGPRSAHLPARGQFLPPPAPVDGHAEGWHAYADGRYMDSYQIAALLVTPDQVVLDRLALVGDLLAGDAAGYDHGVPEPSRWTRTWIQCMAGYLDQHDKELVDVARDLRERIDAADQRASEFLGGLGC